MMRVPIRWILALRLRLTATLGPSGMDTMLFWALLAGLAGGVSSAAFRAAIAALKECLTGQSGNIIAIAESLTPADRLWIPTLGGLLAGFTLWLGSRLFRGLRAQDYLEVIRLGDGVISVKPTLARLLSSLLSISSGASIGREGGMVQLSALVASSLGRLFGLSRPRLRLLVACGGAAGLASAYNTPLAGALFIAEIVLQSLAIEALGPLIVAAVTATLVIRHWIGVEPILSAPDFSMPTRIDLLPLLGLGVLAGGLAPLFLASLDLARRLFQPLHLPLPLSLGLGGLIVGALSLVAPEVWGNGYEVTEILINGAPTQAFIVRLLWLKVLATAAAVGAGTVGGVFTPTLMIGACMGWLYGHWLPVWLPDVALDPVAFAVLGMGAFLAGTTLAPLTAGLMIFEMTLDANLLFPLIVVTLVARYLTALIRPRSVYSQALGDVHTPIAALMHVTELMTTPSAVVNRQAKGDQISEIFCRSTTHSIWVVDDLGHYEGVITLNTLKRFMGDANLQHLNAAAVFMEEDLPSVTPRAALTEALTLLIEHESDRLPVVDEQGHLCGEITKSDLLLALS